MKFHNSHHTNAGCYKTQLIILGLHAIFTKIDGLQIKGFINNEPFFGKDSCDVYSSIIKQKLERAINSGMNGQTPEEIAKAICSLQGVSNAVIQLGKDSSTPGRIALVTFLQFL